MSFSNSHAPGDPGHVAEHNNIANALNVAPVSTTGLWVPAGWGSNWKAAKTAAASGGKATVSVVGNSLARGYCTDLDNSGWVALLRNALQTRYGDGGSGWRGVVDTQLVVGASVASYPLQVTLSNGWSEYFGTYRYDGPGATVINSDNTTGRTATFPGMRGTALKAYYFQASGNGGFTLSVDGGAQSALVPGSNGTTTAALASPVQTAAAGTHVLTVTTAGNGTVICGASAENASGIVVNNYGKSSASAAQFLGTGTFGYAIDWSGGVNYPADLVIMALDAGDLIGTATSPDTYIANIRALVNRLKDTRHGVVDLIFVMSHPGTLDQTSRVYAEYIARIRALAETYGAAFVNMWAVGRNNYDAWADLGYWGVDNGTTGAAGTSAIHLSTAGHAAMYNTISQIPGLL